MGLLTFSPSYALFTALHVVCFALGLAVCGLYGQDLKRAMDSDVDPDSKWVGHHDHAKHGMCFH